MLAAAKAAAAGGPAENLLPVWDVSSSLSCFCDCLHFFFGVCVEQHQRQWRRWPVISEQRVEGVDA